MAKTTPKNDTNPAIPAFEFFQGNLSESSSSPNITVRRGGLMIAAAELLGENAQKVQLAYDRSTRTVGIRAATDDTQGAYQLRQQGKSPNRLVGGKRFFKYNEIPTQKAATFEVIEFSKGLIGFKIDGGTTEKTVA